MWDRLDDDSSAAPPLTPAALPPRQAINTLADKYGELGKTVHLRHLSSDCAGLLARLNGDARPYEVIESDPATDPVYEVAAKSGLIAGVKVPEVIESPPKDPEEWETKLEEAAKDDPLSVS